tara:strand:- start:1109 stop:1879 length:771 start_codon:yes stop_codon:yes gene_type:complete
MVKFLLKKSYQRKDLKEINYRDLWNDHGVFTTMWIYGKPPRILFFKSHIDNLIKSLKVYKIYKKDIKRKILKLIKINIIKNKSYNHLFRIALNKYIISISLRNRLKPKNNFKIELVDYQRVKPKYKNLKYKKILRYLSKMNTTEKDIGLFVNKKILEAGTSNLLFVSKNLIYSPINKYYRGTNFRFYNKKYKIIKKDIPINTLNNYDEIILVGSGKGVVSVKSIDSINWKRKKIKVYKSILRTFKKETKKQKYLYR